MRTINRVNDIIANSDTNRFIETSWEIVGSEFETTRAKLPYSQRMGREEISFHNGIKLLGFLCLAIEYTQGAIVEIGVWKGKSIAFMSKVTNSSRVIIGIDPCEIYNQGTELKFYKESLFPKCILLEGYAERVVDNLKAITSAIALLHIDGGHTKRDVFLDFLLYSPLVVHGGFIVFDDYHDVEHSPEVGPAIDLLRVGGFFQGFEVVGTPDRFQNSYVLKKL